MVDCFTSSRNDEKKVVDDLKIILILLIERLKKPIGEGVNNDKIN